MTRLPEWAEKVMMPESGFETAAYSWYNITTATPGMKKFISGFSLKEILDHFTQKTQSMLSTNQSLWMYFGHDHTVADMLNSLGVFSVPKVIESIELPNSAVLNTNLCSV